ncbi:MAG: DUF262 domain-containing protein [Bombella sp.]|nr:DUF262 domain-containing protein [Bombella sp.]
MSLENEISTARKDIRTDDYPMSIGEWSSMYEAGELDIHPEFQRMFRWDENQKSNLIESIILGIPVPPIFVSQRQNGIWDVIDGLQRLSTIFQFMGILKDEFGKTVPPLCLTSTKYLPSLEGIKWNEGTKRSTLPDEIKRIIKRSKIGVSILLRESDEDTKYDLFQRLNTGGTSLTPQEVRNCIMVMIDPEFYHWVEKLTKIPSFIETTCLSDKLITEKYDMELVLRYIIFSQASIDSLKKVGDVGKYLTEEMEKIAKDKDFSRDEAYHNFKKVFDILGKNLGSDAFKRFSSKKKRHEGGFSVSAFEAVTAGVRKREEKGLAMTDISSIVSSLWEQADFIEWAKSGVNASRRLWHTISFSRNYFTK